VAFGTALLSALCYGLASALQALGARRTAAGRPAGDGTLVGVVRQWPFLLGVLLDVWGFVAQLMALRYLPLFVVQAAQAGNLAVTALAAVPILGIRLAGRQWAAVCAVCAGLALLGASSGPEGATQAGTATRLVLLGAAALVIVGETAVPAAVGIALWHDRTRPGWTLFAAAGFSLAVAGALALARFADPRSA